jgi:hypothetical protein
MYTQSFAVSWKMVVTTAMRLTCPMPWASYSIRMLRKTALIQIESFSFLSYPKQITTRASRFTLSPLSIPPIIMTYLGRLLGVTNQATALRTLARL